MNRYSHTELLDLAAAYAVGSTTHEEAAAIEDAMLSSPELAAEIAAFQQVTTALLLAQPSSTPSPTLRARLLDLIHEDSAARSSAPTQTVDEVDVSTEKRKAIARWVIPAAMAAGILLSAALGVQLVRLREQLHAADAQERRVAASLAHREHTLNSLLHAEKGLRVIHLQAADTVVGPGIQLFWDLHHRSGIVHAFRLPPAPAGHAYQLWAVVDREPVSVQVFDSDPDGHALVEGIVLPPSAGSVSRMLVTVEPHGGSRSPTTVPLLGSSVLRSE